MTLQPYERSIMASRLILQEMIQAEAIRAHDLTQRIIDALLGDGSADGLLDELRDTLDRIDSLAKTLNGAGE